VTERSVANPVAGATALGVGILAAILAVVLAFSVFAKPSGAQVTPAPGELTVEPVELGFGGVQVNTDDDRTVTITNTGGTTLTIGGVKFTDPVTGEEIVGGPFSLAEPLPTGGIVLQPNASTPLELDIRFAPKAEDTGETSKAVLTFIERRIDGTLGDTIALVDQAGNTVQGIDLTGTGTANDPNLQPGAQQDCTVTGTNNGETLTGTSGDDIICALGGRDRVNGLGGSDTIRGGGGNDLLVDPSASPNPATSTNAEADKLYGQGGKDRINSKDGDGNDLVKGGPKFDKINKDAGDQGKKDRRRR